MAASHLTYAAVTIRLRDTVIHDAQTVHAHRQLSDFEQTQLEKGFIKVVD